MLDKIKYVFSDPECPFVCKVCEVLNAFNNILKWRHGTLKLGV